MGIDPKGLDNRRDLPNGEDDRVCPITNFGRRPLGSGISRDAMLPQLMSGEVRVKDEEVNHEATRHS
jgi:hypothetical protein